ncbi:MAG TPA: element excision factor XisH family protein [Candidatus Nanopelagicales bacterium]|nr:element excision factor XisH family protein [Candidatus Nanopelagicales bacterium]
MISTILSLWTETMPARDLYHDAVTRALVADGWEITHDPLTLSFGGRDLYVDLGATHVAIGAMRSGQRIAVEIKSFVSPSPMRDLEDAVGQYVVYRSVLGQIEPERTLYLAVPQRVFEGIFAERIGQVIVSSETMRLVVFDETTERIVRWAP